MVMTTTRCTRPRGRTIRLARGRPRSGPVPPAASRPPSAPGAPCVPAVEAPVNPTELKPPANLHGFELVREDYVAEYDSKVFFFRHDRRAPRS